MLANWYRIRIRSTVNTRISCTINSRIVSYFYYPSPACGNQSQKNQFDGPSQSPVRSRTDPAQLRQWLRHIMWRSVELEAVGCLAAATRDVSTGPRDPFPFSFPCWSIISQTQAIRLTTDVLFWHSSAHFGGNLHRQSLDCCWQKNSWEKHYITLNLNN